MYIITKELYNFEIQTAFNVAFSQENNRDFIIQYFFKTYNENMVTVNFRIEKYVDTKSIIIEIGNGNDISYIFLEKNIEENKWYNIKFTKINDLFTLDFDNETYNYIANNEAYDEEEYASYTYSDFEALAVSKSIITIDLNPHYNYTYYTDETRQTIDSRINFDNIIIKKLSGEPPVI